jgi:pimeloyl-ACP methyl ester carboxylesterase
MFSIAWLFHLVLVPTEHLPRVLYSIIFIHGLQGDPERTWTYGTPKRSPVPLSRLFHSRSKASPETTNPKAVCFWPDLLAHDFKNTRIATYGYDSRVSNFFGGPANQTDIAGHGRSLLHAIEAFRREQSERPIIFIVHSLGGLVLKDALRRSWQAQDYKADLRTVYASTIAIIFMGTPHRGSPYAPWGKIARNVAVASGFDASDRLLRDLHTDSSVLDLLRDDFSKMLHEDIFDVFTFREAKGLKGVRGLTTKVSAQT